ncbi:MAG: hypothetical protein ACPG9F_06225, partial [Cycloclasticus sp.]
MEAFGFFITFLHSVAGLFILGTAVICLLSCRVKPATLHAARQQLIQYSLLLALVLVVSGLFLPSLQAFSISGHPDSPL